MKDFKLNFIHLCDDAIFSQEGKLSLIGIFEVINVVALPGSLLKAYLVFNLNVINKSLDKVDLDISIKKEDTGNELLKLPTLTPSIVKNKADSELKLGLTLQLANITFQETGKYMVELKVNKEHVGTLNFDVKLLQKKGEVN
ncbi:MAG: hypothetical protein Q7K55_07810 [Candidatus Levybacteria bacterium]|nr:hypothetical protein [Candidatus Levybacteria bacterium]